MNSSYKVLPSFRRRQHEPAEYLHEGDRADIYRYQDKVIMSLWSDDWSREIEDLMVQFRVTCLVPRICNRRMFDFLSGHRPLRELRFSFYEPVDLRPVLDLHQLRQLYINWKCDEAPSYEMDFTKLSLEWCHLQLFPQFESILHCQTICSLSADFDHFIKARLLDCSRLPALCDLSISGSSKLERFEIDPNAELTALEIVSCSRLVVDWGRVARDLIHLSLAGTIGFRIAEFRAAKKLRTLILSEMRKQDLHDLSWLLELPALNAVDAPLAGKLSKESERIVRRINQAGGHGAELCTRIGTYERGMG